MNLDDFIKKYNGKFVEVAGPNSKNQCVDLVNAYIDEVLHRPMITHANAIDFPKRSGSNYEWIKNTPKGLPQKGDLMIFKGKYGHISIYLDGNLNKFRSFDQNYPTGSPAHIQGHTYRNVLGWLRGKANTMTIDRDLYTKLVTKSTNADTLSAYFQVKLEFADRAKTIIHRFEKIQSDLEDCQKSVESFKTKLDKQENVISNLKQADTQSKKMLNAQQDENEKLKKEVEQGLRLTANLQAQVDLSASKLETDLKKAKLEYDRQLKDAVTRMSKVWTLKENQYNKQIEQLEADNKKKEVVVIKRPTIPRDFLGRLRLALNLMKGRWI